MPTATKPATPPSAQAAPPGPWQTGQVFPNTRTLAVNGLTPGTSYPIQVRALGGSTQYSDWSDSVQQMSL